jgi:hypothetical protein
MAGDKSGLQARGYSWPPFEEGNKAALRHGAYSVEVYGEVARELVSGVLADRPQLDRYRTAVAAWADVEARCLVLREWLAEHGTLDGDGNPRPAAELLNKLEGRADKARQRLGLDPKADADLARATADAHHAAADLEAVRAAGRRALEAAEVVEDGGDG